MPHPACSRFLWRAVALLLLALCTAPSHAVQLGIDRLKTLEFEPLKGKRVGLITNHTGVDSKGRLTREILHNAKGVNLVCLLTPEHGLDGTELAGKYVATRTDKLTGLMAHSLYGPTRKPTPQMLKGIDTLVYDMQDIGVRSYTYISTMVKCMEAAGELGLEFVVLDRPNPLGGNRIEGPPVEQKWISFVGQIPVPYVHGMTCGELARMLNEKQWMASKCKLRVVTMEGWDRSMVWEDTGLRWVKTSPNIPRADSPAYYIATGIVGSLAGLETGVGGKNPFEMCAAKGIDAQEFTNCVQKLEISGVKATPCKEGGFSGCKLSIDPHAKGNLTHLALGLLSEVNRRSSPDLFAKCPSDKLDIFFKVYGSESIREQLRKHVPVQSIVQSWKPSVDRFKSERSSYLFY